VGVVFRKIVVAIDGSDHAERAFDLACDIGALYGATLALINVVGSGPLPPGLRRMAEVEHVVEESPAHHRHAGFVPRATAITTPRVSAGEQARVWADLSDSLLRRAQSAAVERGVQVAGATSRKGDPAELILEYAKAEGADMIAMGSRGLGDLTALVLGSVSRKVSREAGCTVVAMKQGPDA